MKGKHCCPYVMDDKDSWMMRYLPPGIEVVPSYQYVQNFNKFQQLIGDAKKDNRKQKRLFEV